MQRSFSRTLVAVAVVALLAPGAAATWYSHGTFEPDNFHDDDSFMRVDPPGDATNLLYFNVVTGMAGGAARGIMISPNAGLLESGIETPAAETHSAILGVWIDCNGDGYVGLAESAVREYPAQLLDPDTPCVAASGPTNAWTAGAHNYNGWVSELVPIAGVPVGITANTTDLRVYPDATAMIWGDAGLPDGRAGEGLCPIAPQPRGTYQSTGGFLNYVDCHADRDATGGLGVMESVNRVWFGGRLMGQDVDGLGADPFGLSFANDDNASGSFADRPTFGSAREENSPAYIYDCDNGPTTFGAMADDTPVGPAAHEAAEGAIEDVRAQNSLAGNTTSANYEDLRESTMPVLDPRVSEDDPTSWTAPGLVNHTIEGTNVTGVSVRGSADCDTSNDGGHDFYGASWATLYVGETEFNAVSGVNKKEADFNFQFQYWDRGLGALGVGPQGVAGTPAGPSGAALPGKPHSNWNPGRVNVKGDTNRILRMDIQEGDSDLPAAQYFTFYAYVGSATTGRGFVTPSGEIGHYGAAQCAGYEGTLNPNSGWNCDPTKWYRNPDGTPTQEPTPRARPDQAYQFRDVDCQDGRIGTLGIGVSTPSFGDSPCAPYDG